MKISRVIEIKNLLLLHLVHIFFYTKNNIITFASSYAMSNTLISYRFILHSQLKYFKAYYIIFILFELSLFLSYLYFSKNTQDSKISHFVLDNIWYYCNIEI